MLKSIYIESLFGLYTYNLDMKPEENNGIRFITAPNGYGKTTILNMLDDLYSDRLSDLSEIPFDVFRLHFDDGRMVEIKQNRNYQTDENSDDKILSEVVLNIRFCKDATDNEGQSIAWSKGGIFDERMGSAMSMQLYFDSHPIYYVRDKRLYEDVTTPTVKKNALMMRDKLTEASRRINRVFQLETYPGDKYISEIEYNSVRGEYEPIIEMAGKFGLIKENPFPVYSVELASYLTMLVNKVKSYFGEQENFLKRLMCFQGIVERADFANKKMQINPSYGYRFIANNEDRTIILPDSLSAGEQHKLIMAFDLLFKADDASLILIDEPELSFHMMWQMNFLDNLREITRLRNLQCIVCTHSPQIFDCDFDLAEDLFSKSEEAKLE